MIPEGTGPFVETAGAHARHSNTGGNASRTPHVAVGLGRGTMRKARSWAGLGGGNVGRGG